MMEGHDPTLPPPDRESERMEEEPSSADLLQQAETELDNMAELLRNTEKEKLDLEKKVKVLSDLAVTNNALVVEQEFQLGQQRDRVQVLAQVLAEREQLIGQLRRSLNQPGREYKPS
jgi:hypothetical protein